MDDVTVIDHFLDTFSRYIDSGFGLVHGEVAWLSATLVAIDMTLAGLWWALAHATGQGEDVMAKLIRKVLYVGAFAFLIGHFNTLAGIVFRSFAGLGLKASASSVAMDKFLQPGRLAKTGIDAAAPILDQISQLAGFPEVFVHLTPIVVLFLAWFVVILCFFVLAVIVGIGTGLFGEFKTTPIDSSIDHALVIMLAALSLLALGIFGPGIATGLVSGAPQLGAGAMAGAALGATGTAVALGAAATGAGAAVMAGARMAPAAAGALGRGARMAASTASSAGAAFQSGASAAGGGVRGVAAGVGNVARTGAQAAGQTVASRARAAGARVAEAFRGESGSGSGSGGGSGSASGHGTTSGAASGDEPADRDTAKQPAWAKRLHRRQQITHAASTAANTLRGGNGGGAGQGPRLNPSDE
ncbi:Conjugative transfer protein TrbL [Candidatus Burkholderia verschuerenii]|uniref:Conjugative transfer protein TrbL n=1 Tax=Candidatus Burkholderia verschuerenii TaxID=242163 RepID=A0A0L0MA52_9BURK|nr:type IV secretion system protein [Candidatus Burkholderia verschuerenii]KND59160.1 Conjugative transfer protein TrbL [Candidatus Burkholderia verschuerenii]